MQKGLSKFQRSSGKLINQLISKMKMVRQDIVISEDGGDESNKNIQSNDFNTLITTTSKNIPKPSENLEHFVHELKNVMNFEDVVYKYPLRLETQLNNSIQELECMLQEIRSVQNNIHKQKTQLKLVDKEKSALNKTLKKLKDHEVREMEMIISLFDNKMYLRWQGIKSSRKVDVIERFLSDIKVSIDQIFSLQQQRTFKNKLNLNFSINSKSKQLALENLDVLVSRRLTNLKMFPISINSDVNQNLFPKAIPLPFPSFESVDLSVVPLRPLPLVSSNNMSK